MAKCNDTARKAIEDYHTQTILAIKKMKEDKKNIGVWAPACVQHVFIDSSSFTSDSYKVPSTTGVKIDEAIEQFLKDP